MRAKGWGWTSYHVSRSSSHAHAPKEERSVWACRCRISRVTPRLSGSREGIIQLAVDIDKTLKVTADYQVCPRAAGGPGVSVHELVDFDIVALCQCTTTTSVEAIKSTHTPVHIPNWNLLRNSGREDISHEPVLRNDFLNVCGQNSRAHVCNCDSRKRRRCVESVEQWRMRTMRRACVPGKKGRT